jgi:hypothetical protein
MKKKANELSPKPSTQRSAVGYQPKYEFKKSGSRTAER